MAKLRYNRQQNYHHSNHITVTMKVEDTNAEDEGGPSKNNPSIKCGGIQQKAQRE